MDKSLDLDQVVVYTTDMKYSWGEGPRCLEAKITRLHTHLNSTRIREDDKTVVVTVITPISTVCSSRSTSCSTLSNFSATTDTSLSRLPSTFNLATAARDDWGHFIDVDPPPPPTTRKQFRFFWHPREALLQRQVNWKNYQDGALQVGGTLLGMTITYIVSMAIQRRQTR